MFFADDPSIFLKNNDLVNNIHKNAVIVTQHSRIKAKGIAPTQATANLNNAYEVPQTKEANKA